MKKLPEIPEGKRRWIERGVFAYRERGDNGRVRFGVSYSARCSDGTVRRIRKLLGPDVATIGAARKYYRALRADTDRGLHIINNATVPTFAEFAEKYLSDRRDEIAASLPRARLALGTASSVFGAVPVDKVQPFHVAEYKRRRLAACEPSSAYRDLAVIKRAFRDAVKVYRYRVDNPASDVSVGKWQAKPRRILTVEEEARLVAVAAPHLRPLITVACNTGLRLGELRRLEWRDIDFAANRISVRVAKNKRADESVPINAIARKTLLDLREGGRVGHVFLYRGRPLRNPHVGIVAASRRAGIGHVSAHCFRHTCCTRLIEAGVDVARVKAWMRHANIATTMQYVHVQGLDVAAEKLTAYVESGTQVALASVSPLTEKHETE